MAVLSNIKSNRQISGFIKLCYNTPDKDFCINRKRLHRTPPYRTSYVVSTATDMNTFFALFINLSKQGNTNTEMSIATDGKEFR
jgi:hypothetical protein